MITRSCFAVRFHSFLHENIGNRINLIAAKTTVLWMANIEIGYFQRFVSISKICMHRDETMMDACCVWTLCNFVRCVRYEKWHKYRIYYSIFFCSVGLARLLAPCMHMSEHNACNGMGDVIWNMKYCYVSIGFQPFSGWLRHLHRSFRNDRLLATVRTPTLYAYHTYSQAECLFQFSRFIKANLYMIVCICHMHGIA